MWPPPLGNESLSDNAVSLSYVTEGNFWSGFNGDLRLFILPYGPPGNFGGSNLPMLEEPVGNDLRLSAVRQQCHVFPPHGSQNNDIECLI